MVRKIVFVLLFSMVAAYGYSAELVLRGIYYGFNLYVNNPSVGNGFCVSKVMVNEVVTKDEIQSNAFEIDFSLLNVKIGDAVTIVITYKEGCKPTVVNPKALTKSDVVSLAYAKIDKTGKLVWAMTGEMPEDVFIVEQFRWNKWVKCAEISTWDTVKKNTYSYEFTPHSGLNQFRIVRNDNNGNPVYSKVIKYTSKTAEVLLVSTKIIDKLVFSAETQYEIFDLKGNFITEGFAKEVDVTEIPKGKYWLNFDDKTVNFVRK